MRKLEFIDQRLLFQTLRPRASTENFPGGGQRKEDRKIAKKSEKTLLSLFRGEGATEKKTKK